LPDKSKKISKFSDAALQIDEAIQQIRHPRSSRGGEQGSDRVEK
jgi:hypothetical protein